MAPAEASVATDGKPYDVGGVRLNPATGPFSGLAAGLVGAPDSLTLGLKFDLPAAAGIELLRSAPAAVEGCTVSGTGPWNETSTGTGLARVAWAIAPTVGQVCDFGLTIATSAGRLGYLRVGDVAAVNSGTYTTIAQSKPIDRTAKGNRSALATDSHFGAGFIRTLRARR